jgi:20S proteasome alpha/beta subunit
MNSEKARELLEKKYRTDMNMDEATSLAIETVKMAYGNGLKLENINAAILSVETKAFRKLTPDEIKKFF